MIFEKTRRIDEYDAKRLRKIIRRREKTLRALPRRGLGCLALLTPLCGLVYLVNPSDPVNRWGALILFGVFLLLNLAVSANVLIEERRSIAELEDVIRHGSVTELSVTSQRCFVVVDEDDEINHYFFDVGEETIVVNDFDLVAKDFPNSDFKLFRILGRDGVLADEWTTTHGKQLRPVKSFSVEAIPESVEYQHLSRLPERFDDLLFSLNISLDGHKA